MPMELRTGLPGTFKSCGAVEQLIKFAEDEAYKDRPRYQLGVTGLRPDLAEPITVDQFKDWKSLPAGAIVLVDEAQKVMPARRSGDAPQFIRDMSEHRHRGITFVFVTQNPAMLDKYVRQLVDRHYHHIRKYGSMWAERWEFPECMDDPSSKSAKRISTGKEFVRASTEAMESYTSAELHTIKPKVPKFLKVAAMLVLVIPVMGWMAYHRLATSVDTSKAEAATVPKADEMAPLKSAPKSDRQGEKDHVMTKDEWIARFMPRVAGMPWSAPAYDRLDVQGVPELYCVIGEPDSDVERCHCITEQGTRATVPVGMCKDIAKGGSYNPYRRPVQPTGRGEGRGKAGDPSDVEIATAAQPRIAGDMSTRAIEPRPVEASHGARVGSAYIPPEQTTVSAVQ